MKTNQANYRHRHSTRTWMANNIISSATCCNLKLPKALLPYQQPIIVPISPSWLQLKKPTTHRQQQQLELLSWWCSSWKWRSRVSFFQGFLSSKQNGIQKLKEELLQAISPLDRGAEASPPDKELVEKIVRKLEAINEVKEPLKSNLLNGKWELLYTTSESLLGTKRPKFLRPNGKIYQAINVDTLRAQNTETWPFYNQVTANLVPLNSRRVAVSFDFFKIASLIRIPSPGGGRGQLEITFLDEELRISRGDKGNLFILKMVDPSYRVPL